MAQEKQIMHNFLPFMTKGEVLKASSTQEVFERVVTAAPSSISIFVDMISSKSISVCIFLIIEKKTSHLNINLVSNDLILTLL